MNRDFTKITLLFLLGCLLFSCKRDEASDKQEQRIRPVTQLLEKRFPTLKNKILFELIENSEDKFEIEKSNGKILIKGNNTISLASGLNYYLKKVCKTSFSWTNDKIILPEELPLPSQKITKTSPYKISTYMNYCTFGYSTVFWDWERWEKEIDLMALNGVTHPLAIVGVEAVWRNTLKHFEYSDNEIKDFLSGPAYLPWMLMGNLEKIGGPLPNEWFNRQITLQKKIVAKMRAYGMKPIFQGFYGMVPNSLKEKFPKAKIIPQGEWVETLVRPEVLSPLDQLFEEMSAVWYREYEKLFGKADYFGGDLFHEGGKKGGIDVSEAALMVQKNMTKNNPNAVWVIQAWGENPTEELLHKLDRKSTLVVDLCAEFWQRWKEKDAFYGTPWVWSNISNWGGNIGLHGRLDAIAEGPTDGLKDSIASKWLKGIGFTPEGVETNPIVFDLWSEMRWETNPLDLNDWIQDYTEQRYSVNIQELKEAWLGFYKTAYGTYETHRRPSESIFCAKPSLNITGASTWGESKIFYSSQEFCKHLNLFLSVSDKVETNKNYEYDVVDMVRQYLADLGREAYSEMVKSFNKKNNKEFQFWSERLISLIKDQNKLLSSHKDFILGSWIKNARKAGISEEAKDLYEYNAKLLITTWSEENDGLNDYAHREWGGLLNDFYLPRWVKFIDSLQACLKDKNCEIPPEVDFFGGDLNWSKTIMHASPYPSGNSVEIAKNLFKKYYLQEQ